MTPHFRSPRTSVLRLSSRRRGGCGIVVLRTIGGFLRSRRRAVPRPQMCANSPLFTGRLQATGIIGGRACCRRTYGDRLASEQDFPSRKTEALREPARDSRSGMGMPALHSLATKIIPIPLSDAGQESRQKRPAANELRDCHNFTASIRCRYARGNDEELPTVPAERPKNMRFKTNDGREDAHGNAVEGTYSIELQSGNA